MSACVATYSQRQRPVVAVLGFHKIGPPPPGEEATWNYISEGIFRRQLEYLRTEAWEVIDLATFLRGMCQPGRLPARSALLTFDDGYRSMRTVTLPVLLDFGYPAVLFVPTAFVGSSNSFDEGIEPKEAICTWRELTELSAAGVSIQSHGATHRRFSELNHDERVQELVASKAAIERRLDQPVEALAFPYGDEGSTAGASRPLLVEAGYRAAFLYGGKAIPLPIGEPYRLDRLAMGPDSNLDELLPR